MTSTSIHVTAGPDYDRISILINIDRRRDTKILGTTPPTNLRRVLPQVEVVYEADDKTFRVVRVDHSSSCGV